MNDNILKLNCLKTKAKFMYYYSFEMSCFCSPLAIIKPLFKLGYLYLLYMHICTIKCCTTFFSNHILFIYIQKIYKTHTIIVVEMHKSTKQIKHTWLYYSTYYQLAKKEYIKQITNTRISPTNTKHNFVFLIIKYEAIRRSIASKKKKCVCETILTRSQSVLVHKWSISLDITILMPIKSFPIIL